MSLATWDKNEIMKLAHASGRPLEVQCAQTFLKYAWKVRLGTYYTDIVSEKNRELDFLAEKDFRHDAKNINGDIIRWIFHIRLLGSCKGFAPDQCPATYSVYSGSPSVEKPSFICYECGFHGRTIAESMRPRSAEHFLHSAGLSNAQQVVGFDLLQRKIDPKQASLPPEYLRKTDRELYDGLDSSIKAAMFWYQEDRRQHRHKTVTNAGYIALNIPALVFSLPFWDVPIDNGIAGTPVLTNSGFHSSLYPSVDGENPPEQVMSILWDVSKLEDLVTYLTGLNNYFVNEVIYALEKNRSAPN